MKCKKRKKEGKIMALVGIVMGSDSDMPVMAKAADILEELGISYEMTIISAHREPDAEEAASSMVKNIIKYRFIQRKLGSLQN